MISMDYFALFGITPAYQLDLHQLRERLRELQREYHPDRVAHLDDSARHQAVRQSALVNDAFDTLSHPVKRAHYLLRRQGVELPAESSTFADPTFLMEQLALRETLAEARAAADGDALFELRQQVQRSRKRLEQQLAEGFAAADAATTLIDDARRLTFFLKLEEEIGRAEEALDL